MNNPGARQDANYGEMYIADSAAAIVVNAADEWHAIITPLTGYVNGFTYEVGILGAIASIADAGSGDITVTDVGHGLAVGDIVTINGCTDAAYNGIFEVLTVPSADTFTVTAVFTATDTGMWQRGSNLTCNAAGIYNGKWAASGISAVNAHVFDFGPCVNTTAATKAKSRRKFSNADYGPFSGTGIMEFSIGDKIFFMLQNVGADGNVTIRTLDMNINRL